MKANPTINDVALHAGVSRSTVSMVLNNKPLLRPETVTSVQRAIRELGYQISPRGRRRGLRDRSARVTNRIALLTPGIPRSHMNSPVYMDVLHGVEAAARENGKSLLLTHLPPDTPCPAQPFPHKVDGIILFGSAANRRLSTKIRSLPCVQIMGTIREGDLHDHVSYDNRTIGNIAAKHLISRGHQRVALISWSEQSHFKERCQIFAQAVTAAGGTCLELIDDNLLIDSGPVQQIHPERLSHLLNTLLNATPRPTALFLTADLLAPGTFAELTKMGLEPMKDIDIISCNNEQMLLSHLNPPPATIDIHAEQVGRKAVEQLLRRINQSGEANIKTRLEPTLVQRLEVTQN